MKSAITDIEVVIKVEHYVLNNVNYEVVAGYKSAACIHPILTSFITANFKSFIINKDGIIDNCLISDDQCRQLLAWENIVKFELNTGGIWA